MEETMTVIEGLQGVITLLETVPVQIKDGDRIAIPMIVAVRNLKKIKEALEKAEEENKAAIFEAMAGADEKDIPEAGEAE